MKNDQRIVLHLIIHELLPKILMGWNDKIVVLKKTTLKFYFKTLIEKKKTIQVT